jgi:hypothetical protein
MADNYRVDPKDFLGIKHQVWLSKLYSFALQNPQKYFENRALLLENLKEAQVQAMYDNLYNFLSVGTVNGSAHALVTSVGATPSVPKQEIARIAMEGAELISNLIDNALEKVVPDDYKKLAERRAGTIAAATIGSASSASVPL